MKTAYVTLALTLIALPAFAQNVKITPIGSHAGELCANDRAIVFEDPTGVRLLYDPAHNLTAGDDPRLGEIHVVLLTHMHGDHLGDRRLRAVGAGTCANSERVPAPNSMTAEVVVAKNAVLVTTRAMAGFVASKVQGMVGRPLGVCSQPVAATVPVEAACRSSIKSVSGNRQEEEDKPFDKALRISLKHKLAADAGTRSWVSIQPKSARLR